MAIREKYINPFTDFGFKKLFGTEFNKDLLIDFLNQVLAGKEQIRDLTYLNPENQGKLDTDRKAIFDVYCENERGERFIIEVQNVRQDFFKDRSIFYATFPIQEQAEKGKDWDYALKAVYTIGILNFSFPDKSKEERYLREIQLIDTHTFEVFYDKLSFIYLEMPRFRKNEAGLETHFDKWMYVMNNPGAEPRGIEVKTKRAVLYVSSDTSCLDSLHIYESLLLFHIVLPYWHNSHWSKTCLPIITFLPPDEQQIFA